ncbi:uncharacterized protein B0H18DRAFT_959873 [Fomitopsis serialis]|uniref:uncharacterized protein n=1 Tax=Fomitopsis serialis TaxID=139415 RepID=UPI0020079C17|nr:uncharacterized protein B0H18DRAFT_959873 [Neoantrodia serialis]KAH9914413.1 hypothetical protein B0H18DRAFT_959873 [Neoantrodia serialis]
MCQAAKEAVDPIHLQDLLDNAGLFFAHLRRPEEAQCIYLSLSAPDTLDRYGFLFYESNYLVNEELEMDDIHNSKIVEDKESCYSLLVKHQRRTEHPYPTSVKLTASDFSMELTMSKTKREMLNKWLKKPNVYLNLTPEYQEVVLRQIQAAQNDEETPPLPHIVFERHFKILPNSLLVDPIVHNTSISQDVQLGLNWDWPWKDWTGLVKVGLVLPSPVAVFQGWGNWRDWSKDWLQPVATGLWPPP